MQAIDTDLENILHMCHLTIWLRTCVQNIQNTYNSGIKKKQAIFLNCAKNLNSNITKEDTQKANKKMKTMFNIISDHRDTN